MKLYETTTKLSEVLKKNWYVLPGEVREAVRIHFEEFYRHFSPIRLYPEFLPASWKQNTELCQAIENYLKMLHEDGRPITETTVMAVINLIYEKVKDDIETAKASYLYSAANRYKNPYVYNPQTTQSTITNFSMPTDKEVKTILLNNFDKVNDFAVNRFMEFLQFAQTNHKTTIAGKYLYKYIADISKLTNKSIAAFNTVINFLMENDTITLPPDYSTITKYVNVKNNTDNAIPQNKAFNQRTGQQTAGNLIAAIAENLKPKNNSEQQTLQQVWESFINTFITDNKTEFESAMLVENINGIEIHLNANLKQHKAISYINAAIKQRTNKIVKIYFDNI